MGSYSFKSAGKTQSTITQQQLSSSLMPIGIKTPLQLGRMEGVFAMHYDLGDQIRDNLRNLILTNWGERLGFYDYGANLRPLTTEMVSAEDFDSRAMENISSAVSKWMPYVSLRDFVTDVDHYTNQKTGVINITLTYSIPSLNVENKSLMVTLFVI